MPRKIEVLYLDVTLRQARSQMFDFRDITVVYTIFPVITLSICVFLIYFGAKYDITRALRSIPISAISVIFITLVSSLFKDKKVYYPIYGIFLGIFLVFIYVFITNRKYIIGLAQWSTLRKIKMFAAEKRIMMIFLSFLLAIIFTYPISSLAMDSKYSSFWLGFYQSWTAGLVAFGFFGVVSIIVSLHRPENENLRRRIEILFGRDVHLDYIENYIREMGCYNKICRREYTILEHNPENKSFKVEIKHMVILRNFVKDSKSIEKSSIKILLSEDDMLDPPPDRDIYGQVRAFRVGTTAHLPGPLSITPNGINRDAEVTVEGGEEIEVETDHWLWMKEKEPLDLTLTRFSHKIDCLIKNRCVGNDGLLTAVAIIDNDKEHKITLPYNQEILLTSLTNHKPNQLACSFRLFYESKEET